MFKSVIGVAPVGEALSAGPAPRSPFHAMMSCLAFQATVLERMQAGETARMRWMVRAVA